MITLDVAGKPIDVYTYKPQGYRGDRFLMVFHGVLRNADEYRDHAKSLGDRFRALVAAPKFDAERFPQSRYQEGGILQDGSPQPPDAWTFSLIPQIASLIRKIESKPHMPYYLIGHSAGGQFVQRMAGFVNTGAERLVTSNPGSDLFPTRDLPYPYGFGGLPESLSGDDSIRQYLAQPLVFFLGTGDLIQDENFPKNPNAMKQGDSRLARGRACYQMGKSLADKNGWPFGWRLVEAIAIDHDHEKMFSHPIVEIALFGRYSNLNSSKTSGR
jgi:pimeloyl-ACP methyl ester carboxylesterase